MWCFFDESYPEEDNVASIVACLMNDATVSHVDQILFQAQKKHFSHEHARDLSNELKGKDLLSKYSFKMAKKHGFSKNHDVVREILTECLKHSDAHPVLVFGAAVYGAKEILKHPGKLAFPLTEILKRVSAAARDQDTNSNVTLVFDEKLADRDVAIALRRFIAGTHLPNVSHYPLVGVSHVTPGIQLADIGAFILGRRAIGDPEFTSWLSQLRQLEWTGTVDGYSRMGIQRWDADPSGSVRVRKKWA